jgi:aspartate aminotransferase
MVHLCEGKAKFIETSPNNSFKISPEQLKRHITTKTKALILNSPSNPTGCVYTPDELREIASICVAKKIFVISDEIYEKIIFDNLEHKSIASFGKSIYDLTITVNGLSKSFSMTGWRIGYIGAPIDIAEAISRLQDHSTSNPTSIAQKAAEAALSAPQDFSRQASAEFQKRRDFTVGRLNKMRKIKCVVPQGAFYIFCDISATKMGSAAFAEKLLDEKYVALIPGEGFGRDDFVRISFATSIEKIAQGMDRLEEFLG